MQTQRLELLTAQNMAIDNVSPAKQPDSHVVQERPPIADEGDEVHSLSLSLSLSYPPLIRVPNLGLKKRRQDVNHFSPFRW